MGGQGGISGHLKIGDYVRIAGENHLLRDRSDRFRRLGALVFHILPSVLPAQLSQPAQFSSVLAQNPLKKGGFGAVVSTAAAAKRLDM